MNNNGRDVCSRRRDSFESSSATSGIKVGSRSSKSCGGNGSVGLLGRCNTGSLEELGTNTGNWGRLGEAWKVLRNAAGRIGEAGAQHTMLETLFQHSMALHKV